MKTIKCDLCEVTADGEAFEDWMQALLPHYMDAHADVMKGKEGMSAEDKKQEMDKWMSDNRVRFDAV
ncbi:MAG: hypothetical protein LR008_00980 [Candidatus Pacebacteria bacterium]|nr:hypothetical protein [Candidatus Paceibacterota bacterium]